MQLEQQAVAPNTHSSHLSQISQPQTNTAANATKKQKIGGQTTTTSDNTAASNVSKAKKPVRKNNA